MLIKRNYYFSGALQITIALFSVALLRCGILPPPRGNVLANNKSPLNTFYYCKIYHKPNKNMLVF